MTINWGALALVAAVTIVGAMMIVGLFSLGVASLTARERSGAGAASLANTVVGYVCFALSGAIAVYGLYLIIPQFH
jgi:hypothetical protein